MIYERLKSPSRLKSSPNHVDLIRSDDFKGYERVGRLVGFTNDSIF